MNNLDIWNKFNQPPKSALKEILAGRMKGKTDINPQWRFKAMTEVFGVIGLGWKYTIDKQWTQEVANGEVLAFVNVSVFIKADGQWSDAIPGSGGHKMIAKEKDGAFNNDEAYKMATTDALSVAFKSLGVAADIYMGLWDGSKYAVSEKSNRPELVERYNKLVEKAVFMKLANIPDVTAEMSEEDITALGISLKARIEEKEKAGK